MKKLKKSNNKIICGVCGGLSEYFNFDATIIRLIVCVLSVFSFGTGILLYIVAALIMPSADTENLYSDNVDNLKSANIDEEEAKSGKKQSKTKEKEPEEAPHSDEEFNSYFKN